MIDDGFEHNPRISRQALATLHEGAFGWALSLSGYNAQAAEDVMQQAYLAVLEGSARYGGDSSLKTWLYAVIRNMARRQARSASLEQARVAEYGASEPADAESVAVEAPDEAAARVREAIRALPERQRQVLELVIDAEFTLAETAAVLGIGVGSARTHYHRAKQTLRAALEQTDGG